MTNFWNSPDAPKPNSSDEPITSRHPQSAAGDATSTRQHEVYTAPNDVWHASTEASSVSPSAGLRRPAIIVGAIALMLGSGYVGGLIASDDKAPTKTVISSSANNGGVAKPAAPPTESLAKIADNVMPSVVSISVEQFGGTEDGSGVVLSDDGKILTNNHVVEGATGIGAKMQVKFSDGKTANARILGRDPSSDLAVIQAEGVSGLKAATFGSVDTIHVGDTVLAIGSPLGLDGTVTSGIISSLHRSVNLGGGGSQQRGAPQYALLDAIQTDAAINPGNSGGALVNMSGEVIGINSAIASLGSSFGSQSGSIGVGFAIPIDEAKRVADQLAAGQTPQRGAMGVSISQGSRGVFVAAISPGGPADKAGIRVNDIVLKIDDTEIKSETALISKIRSHKPGDSVNVTFQRGDQTSTVAVTLTSATS